MFWNKILNLAGYVETVDGYIVKESECKKVVRCRRFNAMYHGIDEKSKIEWHKKETAPKYDYTEHGNYYRDNVEVYSNGVPIGHYYEEEVEELKKEIKELKDKYEPSLLYTHETVAGGYGVAVNNDNIDDFIQSVKGFIAEDKPKKKVTKKKKASKKKK